MTTLNDMAIGDIGEVTIYKLDENTFRIEGADGGQVSNVRKPEVMPKAGEVWRCELGGVTILYVDNVGVYYQYNNKSYRANTSINVFLDMFTKQ